MGETTIGYSLGRRRVAPYLVVLASLGEAPGREAYATPDETTRCASGCTVVSLPDPRADRTNLLLVLLLLAAGTGVRGRLARREAAENGCRG
jgi:hypothetical protein